MRNFWKLALLGTIALFGAIMMTGCASQPSQTREKITLYIGGMTAEELERTLDREKILVTPFARSMLRNKEEFVEPVNKRRGKTETLHLVRLRVRDLGFTHYPTTTELFVRAKERGLDLCPPEVGPYLQLAHKDQPSGSYYIGMEPVTDSDGRPGVFGLGRDGGGLWVDHYWAPPGRPWNLGARFVFSVRKPGLPAGRSDS